MRKVALLLLTLFLCNGIMKAGQTGKLQGTITDKNTGETLIGVNVIIEGTTLGASTDETGFYYITRIPPGEYKVKISMVGYQSIVYEQIRIMSDVTSELDVQLIPSDFEMESIYVVAKEPVVQKDRTSTNISIDGTTIADELRAQDVDEILELQAGITVGTDGAFHVRGGRTGGTVYQIDGISLTNPFDRSLAGNLEVENVQELQAMLGTFDAEYGNASDAVIKINTKDGGDRYKLKFTYESPMLNSSPYHKADWNLNRDDIKGLPTEQKNQYLDAVRKPDGSSAYEHVSVLDDKYADKYVLVNMLGTMAMNVSGPVPLLNDIKFVASGRFRNEDSPLPFGYNMYRNASLKLTYPITSSFIIRGSYDWSQNFYQSYDHQYKYWRWFDSGLDTLGRSGSYPMNKHLSNRQLLSIRHVLSKDSYYDLSFARISDYESYMVPDRYVKYDEETGDLIESNYKTRLYVDGIDGNFWYGDVRYWRKTKSTQYIAKGNLESQVTKHNLVRAGFVYKQHEIFRHSIGMPPRSRIEFFTFEPYEIAAYVQDKIEYDFMILKLGLRFDYFDPKASEYPDLSNILETVTTDGTTDYKTVDKVPVDPHYQFSPRIGLAHPISDATSVHFAYGHFFQIPRFYDLYRNDALRDILANDALVGNPGLKPEKTVSYEVGLQQELTPDWGLNITAYSKDITNLISSFYYFVGRDYTIFTNMDFAKVQGIDITLDKRFNDNYSFRLTYSLMYAEGNESDPTEGYSSYREEDAHLRPNRNYPLDFDQRHKINSVLTVKFPESFGPTIFGFHPFENLNISGILTVGSGLPYTPTSAEEDTDIVPEPNSARRPWTSNLDLKISRTFSTSYFDLTAFVDIENVFDAINTRYIWSRTGDAWDGGPTANTPLDRQANPANVDIRRQIRAGFFIEL